MPDSESERKHLDVYKRQLQDIAAYILKKTDIPTVEIGGSVGKTSTKEAVASVLEQRYSVLKTDGNFNNDLGVPLTVFGIKEENNAAVIETGIDDFGQMELLSSIVRPCLLYTSSDTVCIITGRSKGLCGSFEKIQRKVLRSSSGTSAVQTASDGIRI